MRTGARRAAERRCSGDGGTAILEFTLVAVLLLTIVFGIINFGLILSFKQDMTRAAAEGARTGAVALPSSVWGTNDPRRLAAQQATEQAVGGFNKTCGTGGLTCTVSVHDCDDAVPDTNGYHEKDPTANTQPGNTANAQPDCVTVDLAYDYKNNPLLVPVPLISAFLPEQIRAKSVARLN
ncbi:MAG: TadE/TadG family type IV pilus assembly protein [Microthrixaceae bacterium]